MAVFIIAEAGVNHNGDMNLAKKLIDMAADCGANAIKFQTFKAEESTGIFAEKALYQQKNDKTLETQYEMLKRLELPFDQFNDLKNYCKKKNIMFISTPDGVESLALLVDINVELIKIGSTEITNMEFLKKIAKTGKKLVLSTGMSTLGEVEKAIEVIYKTGNHDLRLMHCTTDYPTKVEDVNINAMVTMRQAFKLPVGYSDHTEGFEAAVAAVALGAEFLEKHITLDRTMKGPDHNASMNPKEFKEYVQYVRNTEKLLGDGIKKPTKNELANLKNIRRKIVAARDIKKDEMMCEEMIALKRSDSGICAEYSEFVVGRRLKNEKKRDQAINWEDI
ncbi:N-acetylneuraminate synthase [Acetobacterium wieringae]|uniref:N-acetylneuraminate synthase n=1 Tax=Acetobacterium wieringae TaxID=52694 RepID=UPI002B20FCDD|nr:N-acetylneuraminate synthase [Acetobacterium wieringae]MEA4804379.1 N-acetylneuraminate synthase [Acetobacterium wieringae]